MSYKLEFLWRVCGRASERGIQRSEVPFLMEIQIFSSSYAREKTIIYLPLLLLSREHVRNSTYSRHKHIQLPNSGGKFPKCGGKFFMCSVALVGVYQDNLVLSIELMM